MRFDLEEMRAQRGKRWQRLQLKLREIAYTPASSKKAPVFELHALCPI
jgi:hypothetical protein